MYGLSWVTRTVMLVCIVSCSQAKYYPNCYNPRDCELPDCYCKYEDIPGGIPQRDTPQMILFTYSGALPKRVRQAITDVFPSSLRNPNNCPVGITLFVVSQGTDDCGLHKLYVRGHEVGLSGLNRTSQVDKWEQDKWSASIVGQQLEISELSNIDTMAMAGVRAQKLRPGGDAQFQMMSHNSFMYDSSLVAGPSAENDFEDPYLWPFTLNRTLKELEIPCKIFECPTKSYPSLWEVPVSPLVGTRMGKVRLCTYLDDCLSDYKKASDVTDLLKRHFRFSYLGNRAPLMINLQPRTMETKIAVDGIKDFIKYIIKKDDTWILTIQEALQWVQNPTSQNVILDQGFWDCHGRTYVKCSEMDDNNQTGIAKVSFRDIIDVDSIWIWQTVALIVSYLAIYRYDKEVQDRKKRKKK